MCLVKIKDSYLFKSEQKDGEHYYCLYYDKKQKEYRAIQTTHIYRPDNRRFKQIESGSILKAKLPSLLLPSGVRNCYYATDIDGKKIDIKNKNVTLVSKHSFNKNLSSKIQDFSNGRFVHKKPKKKDR